MSTPSDPEMIETEKNPDATGAGVMQRRHFLRVAAAAAAATGGVGTTAVLAQQPPAGGGGRGGGAGGGQQAQQAPPIPLGNGESPALHFQAYPGGTGALMEKLIREQGIAAFERRPIEIEPWQGPVPTSEEDLAFLPAHRLGALLRERHISSMDITEVYLERLKRYNPLLLAAVTILEGRAREEAQQADAELRAGQWRGPLHGVPYGIKDLFSVSGAPTTWGSADFEHQVIDEDADLVVRLREAGAVLIAKLATGQFALGANWFRGRTSNPWNPAVGSGGSSAGPGAATAAGLVGFSIGTETQGSITGPSTTCGINGLRPTFGRVSRHGGMVLSWSMDKPGPMCRSLEDCALVFNVIHGADEKDASTLTAPFRFERLSSLAGVRVGHAANTPEPFLEGLSDLGAELKLLANDALPPVTGNQLTPDEAIAFDFHVGAEARAHEEAGDLPSGRFFNGRAMSALDYMNSQRRRHIGQKLFNDALEALEVDVFMVGGGATHQTGHPLVVLPYTFGPGAGDNPTPAQPRTVTVWGHLFQDDRLLSILHAYQVKHDWHLRRPSLQG